MEVYRLEESEGEVTRVTMRYKSGSHSGGSHSVTSKDAAGGKIQE